MGWVIEKIRKNPEWLKCFGLVFLSVFFLGKSWPTHHPELNNPTTSRIPSSTPDVNEKKQAPKASGHHFGSHNYSIVPVGCIERLEDSVNVPPGMVRLSGEFCKLDPRFRQEWKLIRDGGEARPLLYFQEKGSRALASEFFEAEPKSHVEILAYSKKGVEWRRRLRLEIKTQPQSSSGTAAH